MPYLLASPWGQWLFCQAFNWLFPVNDPKRPVFSWLLHDSWENTLKPGIKQYIKSLNITMEWGLSSSLHISSSSHRGGNIHQPSFQPHSNVLGRDFSRLALLPYLLFSEKLSHWGDYHKLKFKCIIFPFFFFLVVPQATMQDLSSPSRDQIRQWKYQVLTTGLLGNSSDCVSWLGQVNINSYFSFMT